MADFDAVLRQFMGERGIGVRELARQVPCSPGYVSNLCSGNKKPSAVTARRIDEVLGAGGSLAVLAAERRSSRSKEGTGASPFTAVRPADATSLSLAEAEEVVGHLDGQWHALVKADNLLGPRHAWAGVSSSLAVIAGILRAASGPTRMSALGIAARYAESAAWLHEDMADMAAARYWTRQAMEWALEGDDRHMLSWVLFRRSQQAATGRDGRQTAALAAAARREAGTPGGPMLAAILQQEAHAHALIGNEAACHAALDQAQDNAAAADDPGDASSGHGSFCTPAYLEVQRGACWLALGRPDRGLAALENAVSSLPPAYRRDRGIALSYQAMAFAGLGEAEAAALAALAGAEIGRAAGSRRLLGLAAEVAGRLAAQAHIPAVARLRSAVADPQAV